MLMVVGRHGDFRLESTLIMTTIIRTDASIDIGNGHVMRCLTLANALRDKGEKCHFVCRLHDGNMVDFIRKKGFSVHVLPARSYADDSLGYSSWLGGHVSTDANDTLNAIKNTTTNIVDWVVVDHYAIDIDWERVIRPHCKLLLVIDDLADRAHDCNLLVDQTLGRLKSDYSSLVPMNCDCIIGPAFSILRPEFQKLRSYSLKRRQPPRLKTLLITLGGTDKYNVASDVLDVIQKSDLSKECRIVIVMGSSSPWLKDVMRFASNMEWEIDVQVDVDDMAQLMSDSDLCIGAAGGTAWERCCLGLPTLMLQLADNQKKIARELSSSGCAILLNNAKEIGFYFEKGRVERMLEDLSFNSSLICDGTGLNKTINSMSALKGIRCHI